MKINEMWKNLNEGFFPDKAKFLRQATISLLRILAKREIKIRVYTREVMKINKTTQPISLNKSLIIDLFKLSLSFNMNKNSSGEFPQANALKAFFS